MRAIMKKYIEQHMIESKSWTIINYLKWHCCLQNQKNLIHWGMINFTYEVVLIEALDNINLSFQDSLCN